VLAGRGRGWIGGGPKARARSRGPGGSFFLFLFLFSCSDGGERGGLTSWPRPGGGNPMYICHGRKAAVFNMKKQTKTNNKRSPGDGPKTAYSSPSPTSDRVKLTYGDCLVTGDVRTLTLATVITVGSRMAKAKPEDSDCLSALDDYSVIGKVSP
jgi:hypothetical protein